jgi:phosphotransferase system  glucose/maltose/N-acetylglucosamine-specific IIC component
MKALRHFDYVKAWLAYTLGATILGAFGGAFIGIILGIILGAARVPPSQGKIIVAIVGLMFGIPFSYFMFRLVVNKFIVSKLAEENQPAP